MDGVSCISVQVASDNESVTVGNARDYPLLRTSIQLHLGQNRAGNLSDATNAIDITIDKDVPAVEPLDLKAAFDTGISDVDDITNATEPVFTLSGLGRLGNSAVNIYYQRTNNVVADTFLLTHTLAQQVTDEITIPNLLKLRRGRLYVWYDR